MKFMILLFANKGVETSLEQDGFAVPWRTCIHLQYVQHSKVLVSIKRKNVLFAVRCLSEQTSMIIKSWMPLVGHDAWLAS